jgi:hypothetical protein
MCRARPATGDPVIHGLAAALLLVGLVSTSANAAVISESWRLDYCQALRDLASGKVGLEESRASRGALEMQAHILDYRKSVPAILHLWIKDEPIELLWWQKDDRVARAFILSLYLPMSDEGSSALPSFQTDAKRFQPGEARERLDELEYVRTHLPSIAKLIVQGYQRLGITEHRTFELYRGVAAAMPDNQPLECR